MAKKTPSPIGKRLTAAREFLGISGRELDRLADKAEGHAGLLEGGHIQTLSFENLAAYASVIGVSVEWLATGAGEQPSPEGAMAAVEAAWAALAERRPSEAPKMAPALARLRARLFGGAESGALPADASGEHALSDTDKRTGS